ASIHCHALCLNSPYDNRNLHSFPTRRSSDLKIVREIARAFVTAFHQEEIDAIVTVETKGIPLAYAVADILNIPVIIIRRNMRVRSEEHTSELQSRFDLVCRLLLEKKNL